MRIKDCYNSKPLEVYECDEIWEFEILLIKNDMKKIGTVTPEELFHIKHGWKNYKKEELILPDYGYRQK